MSTRFSLPRDGPRTATARGARILAALVLIVTVIALSVMVALMPASAPDVAIAPERESAPTAVVMIGA